MMDVLVDSNVLLDIFLEDPEWFDWSRGIVREIGQHHQLCINPIIYAEVSVYFDEIETLEAALPEQFYRRRALPFEAAFLAGKSFFRYRKRGGLKRSPLPDFFIGAHAAISQMKLITRDARRYKTYYPTLDLITPQSM